MSPLHEHLLIWPLKVPMQGFFDSLIFSPQNPRCNDFFENFHKILIPCLESRVMKLMTRNLVEIEANLWHGISDPELMTGHSTNDMELFRKMTSLILMGKISPPGHCHMPTDSQSNHLLWIPLLIRFHHGLCRWFQKYLEPSFQDLLTAVYQYPPEGCTKTEI